MKPSSIAWNAAGLLAPLAIALLTVPLLLAHLGLERFGLLSLAWALTAVSGLFDLGLGRATTRLIADQLGRHEPRLARSTMAEAVRVAALAGLAGGALVVITAAAGATRLIHVSDAALAKESTLAMALLAAAVPLQTLIASYRGVSEACQRFRGISLVRMLMGMANFAAPLAVVQVTQHLAALAASLVVVRLLACASFRALADRALPLGSVQPLDLHERRRLLQAGGWFSISAVISPLLVQADRFLIGAMISAMAVATYTVPFDVVTQLLIGVTAVSTVAFPSITHMLRQDAALARRIFRRWLSIVAVGMALLCGGVAALLPWALRLWVGNALPAESISIGRWLCLGVWINGLGVMYIAWLHAHGRFRATALLHLTELPLYLLLLFILLGRFGVVGAATAWVLRVALDSAGLAFLARGEKLFEASCP